MRYVERPSIAKCIVNPLRPSLVDIPGDHSSLREVTDCPIRQLQNLRGALNYFRTGPLFSIVVLQECVQSEDERAVS
jgi:hypothetical protein